MRCTSEGSAGTLLGSGQRLGGPAPAPKPSELIASVERRFDGSSPLDEKQRIAREIEKQFATLDEGRVHPREFAFNLIAESVDSWRTKGYDWYQLKTNGIRI